MRRVIYKRQRPTISEGAWRAASCLMLQKNFLPRHLPGCVRSGRSELAVLFQITVSLLIASFEIRAIFCKEGRF